MKRWLFNVVAAASLLLSLLAAAAWAMSHVRPLDWRLLAVVHSADVVRVELDRASVVSVEPAGGPELRRHGFLDAVWTRSQSGTLSLVAQAADYEGLRALSARPWSLTVDLRGSARARAVTYDRVPDSRAWGRRLGFAWAADVQQATGGRDGPGGSASAQSRMISVPYWFVVLLGLPVPLLWARTHRRQRRRRTAPLDCRDPPEGPSR